MTSESPNQPADVDRLRALTKALGGDIKSVRLAAVAQLRALGTTEAAQALISVLNEDDQAMRSRAFTALQRITLGPEHVEPLVELTRVQGAARVPALRLLAPLASDPRVPPVFVAMIADGLWRFDGYRSVEAALVRHGKAMIPQLCGLLRSSDETVRRLAFGVLGEIGDNTVLPLLLDHLARVEDQERSDMMHALSKIGPLGVTIDAALAHPSTATRVAVVRALSDPNDLPRLNRAARDADPNVRYAVMGVLSNRMNPDSKPQRSIVERGLGDPDQKIRQKACELVYRLGPNEAVPLLMPRLKDRNASVRSTAVKVLGWCEQPDTVAALSQDLTDRNSWVRVEAAKALGRLVGRATLPVDRLIKLLDDRERFARMHAAEVLGALKERAAVAQLRKCVSDKDEWVRQAAARALGAIGDTDAVPTLDHALQIADELTRREAAAALVSIGTPTAFAVLTEAARRNPSDYAVITALTYTHDPNAIPALELILSNRENWEGQIALRNGVEDTLCDLRRTAPASPKDG
jgi:HEAT repeat protein